MAISTQKFKVRITFIEQVLGTVPKDKEVYASYIASKADDSAADELETVPNVEKLEEKGWTGFHQLPDGTPIFYDYLIKGFFKEACRSLRQVKGSESEKLTAFKTKIDGMVFITPRRILLHLDGQKMSMIERPLRADTAQGPRVTLARSDALPSGTWLEFEAMILGDKVITVGHLEEWLAYGALKGLGQWRSGGWGTFDYQIEPVL